MNLFAYKLFLTINSTLSQIYIFFALHYLCIASEEPVLDIHM